jgi:TRAP-type C4-dicarboxylate transport system permease small subunit
MLRLVDRIAEALAVSAFFVSSGFIFLNVVNRYLVLGFLRDLAKDYEGLRPLYFAIRDALGNIVVTADEVPGYLLVWVAFLGAYLAMRKEGHIAFELLVDALSPRIRQFMIFINTSLIIGFLLLLFWQSIRMIRVAGATEIETAEIAQGWFMLILPIAAILLGVACIVRLGAGNKSN